jgi:hypothetical protein
MGFYSLLFVLVTDDSHHLPKDSQYRKQWKALKSLFSIGPNKNKIKKGRKRKEINASVPISGALDLIFSLRETLSKLELLLLGPFLFVFLLTGRRFLILALNAIYA